MPRSCLLCAWGVTLIFSRIAYGTNASNDDISTRRPASGVCEFYVGRYCVMGVGSFVNYNSPRLLRQGCDQVYITRFFFAVRVETCAAC